MTEPVQPPQSNRKQLFEKYRLSIGIVIGFCAGALAFGGLDDGGDYQDQSQMAGNYSAGGYPGGGGEQLPPGYGGQMQPGYGGVPVGGMANGGMPMGGNMGGGAPAGGGTDMNAWRAQQQASDIAQEQRVQSIREEQTCSDGRVVSIHTGC